MVGYNGNISEALQVRGEPRVGSKGSGVQIAPDLEEGGHHIECHIESLPLDKFSGSIRWQMPTSSAQMPNSVSKPGHLQGPCRQLFILKRLKGSLHGPSDLGRPNSFSSCLLHPTSMWSPLFTVGCLILCVTPLWVFAAVVGGCPSGHCLSSSLAPRDHQSLSPIRTIRMCFKTLPPCVNRSPFPKH